MKLMPPFLSKDKAIRLKETFGVSFRLLGIVWQNEKRLFIGNLIAVLVPAVFPFITAYIFKLIIDLVVQAIPTHVVDYQRLFVLFAILFFINYIQSMAFTFQDYVTRILYTKFPITLFKIILDKVSSLDMQYFEDSEFHDTLQKVRESYSWRPLELIFFNFYILQSIVQVSIALVAIITLNPYLALLVFLVSVPDLLNQLFFSKFTWGIWNRNTPNRKKFSYLADIMQEKSSVRELKIFGLREKFLDEITQTLRNFFEENSSIVRRQLKFNSLFNLLDALVGVGIAAYVVLQAFTGRITIGSISFYQAVITNFNNGIAGFFRNLTRIFDNSQYVKSVFDVLDLPQKIVEKPNAVKVDFHKTPVIEFKDVTFSYPGTKRKIFDNFSLVIKPGEKVAFVGENGAGKTTLIKLLSRFYDIDSGEILIDGVNLKDLDLNSWYRCLGVLFQEFIRYEYPAKDNIYFGRVWEKQNLEEIITAAKSAGAHEMIKKFDKEYGQMLGQVFEGGLELSGGQWQKIALARAFFRSAPVLVLDEPTANIDAKAESEIFNRVENLSKDKTVIIISHRFSTVRNADKVYVIDSGKIVESGTHQQLMKMNGRYATLFNLQAKGYK